MLIRRERGNFFIFEGNFRNQGCAIRSRAHVELVHKFHAVQTFVEETQMVQISKNEAFVVLASSNQPKLKEQFSN